jgi:hypothetical protein
MYLCNPLGDHYHTIFLAKSYSGSSIFTYEIHMRYVIDTLNTSHLKIIKIQMATTN